MLIERDADDVARCFALERLLGAGGTIACSTGRSSG